MSFSSGTYSLYATGNPVVTNTTISSTWANNTLNDIATALSTCMLKDGTQTATASVGFAQGIDVTTAATTTSTTFAVFNTTATTINAFGGASTALNIGHASAAAAFPGGISIPTGKSVTGAGTSTITGFNTIAAATGIAVGGATPDTGGLAFPNTAVSVSNGNVLDDYEESTWVAGFSPLTSGTITINTAIKTGTYTKVGRKVTVTGLFNVTSVSSPTGRLRLTGLPFAADTGNQFEAPVVVTTDTLTSNVALIGIIPNTGNFIDFWRLTTPTTDDAAALVQANSSFRISATYFAAT